MMTQVIDFRSEQLVRHNGAQRTVESSAMPLIWLPTAQLGPMIRTARKARGMNLVEVLMRGEIYRDFGTLGKVERGQKDIDYLTVCHIADVLHAPQLVSFANALVLDMLRLTDDPEVA